MYSLTTNVSNSDRSTYKNINNKPNFKGIGSALMNASSVAMNTIEKGGFVTSFLIQDTLGMTAPRTYKGLYRDRDEKKTKFKDLNFKEAVEVFIREFLSGALMMLTPFLAFALTKKFISKTSTTNTGLLKHIGKCFTSTVKGKATNVTAKGVKSKFYSESLKQIAEDTIPAIKDKPAVTDLVKKTTQTLKKMDVLEERLKTAKGLSISQKISNLFSKIKIKSEKSIIKEELNNLESGIVKNFNTALTTHSTDFHMTNKVKFNGDVFRTSDTVKAIRAYIKDASKIKNIAEFTEENAKHLEKTTMGKRIFSTIATSLAVIGSTSIVPKLYSMLNPVAPGAMTATNSANTKATQTTNKTQKSQTDNKDNKKGSIQFKGNPLRQLQFDRNQLTPLLMSVLTLTGLLGPRINTAIKRAPIDEDTGKKNLIEVPEILTRDVTSVGTVILGVPVLSKTAVNLYKKQSGFVLMDKPKETKSAFKKILEFINPFSKSQPYSSDQIESIYGNIKSKEQLANFTEFIDKNDGNLTKIFKTLKNGKSTFKGTEADFDIISKLDVKKANAKIKKVIKTFDNETVTKFMESTVSKSGKVKPNGMVTKAKGLNSLPKFISTFILVPAFLGLILPKIVYGVTAKNRKKLEEQKRNAAANKAKDNTIIQHKEIKNPIKVKTRGTSFENISKHNVK